VDQARLLIVASKPWSRRALARHVALSLGVDLRRTSLFSQHLVRQTPSFFNLRNVRRRSTASAVNKPFFKAIAGRRPGGQSALHPTAAVRHGLACRSASALRSGRLVNGQLLGVDFDFLAQFSPLMLNGADDRLAGGGDVDALNNDLLLPFAAMPIQSFDEQGMRAGELLACHACVTILSRALAVRTFLRTIGQMISNGAYRDEEATSILVSTVLSVLTFPRAIYLINRGLGA
jgi:hypothetical protein